MSKIRIKKSSTADTRTCDWSKVTKDVLLSSSRQHIEDVREGLHLFVRMIIKASDDHDHTKISAIDSFFADFQNGFKTTKWWEMHEAVERHHISNQAVIRYDVNLIDVLEYVVDCVMAGKARSGSVYPLKLPHELLEKAFQNTVKILTDSVEVEP